MQHCSIVAKLDHFGQSFHADFPAGNLNRLSTVCRLPSSVQRVERQGSEAALPRPKDHTRVGRFLSRSCNQAFMRAAATLARASASILMVRLSNIR